MLKRALVLGLGVSGRAAIALLQREQYEIVGLDRKDCREDPFFKGMEVYVDGGELPKGDFSLVVLSPGIPFTHPLVQKLQEQKVPVIGETELAFRFLQNRAVAITGTNGKTTVTYLVEHILNSSGKQAKALGNVGTPLAAYVLAKQEEEILVVELSSYQLEAFSLQVFQAGVLLNITPDHLDRYGTMEHYAKAKALLQHCIQPAGNLYLSASVQQEYGHLFTKQFSILEQEEEVFLLEEGDGMGKHDRENNRAAWVLCRELGISKEEFLQGLRTFTKPPHRIQFVRERRGVSYYDDSKGTNIDAVICSVDSMKGQVILLAGGVDKGASYLLWKETFTGKVRKIFAFGQAAKKISCELGLFFNVQIVDSLEKAVEEAALEARQGESVLLSPGCSSYDMFRDYAHRGKEFQKLVGLLEE